MSADIIRATICPICQSRVVTAGIICPRCHAQADQRAVDRKEKGEAVERGPATAEALEAAPLILMNFPVGSERTPAQLRAAVQRTANKTFSGFAVRSVLRAMVKDGSAEHSASNTWRRRE